MLKSQLEKITYKADEHEKEMIRTNFYHVLYFHLMKILKNLKIMVRK